MVIIFPHCQLSLYLGARGFCQCNNKEITSADRAMASNIKTLKAFQDPLCSRSFSIVATTTRLLANDLILYFDLTSYFPSSIGVLALWVRNSDKVVLHLVHFIQALCFSCC